MNNQISLEDYFKYIQDEFKIREYQKLFMDQIDSQFTYIQTCQKRSINHKQFNIKNSDVIIKHLEKNNNE